VPSFNLIPGIKKADGGFYRAPDPFLPDRYKGKSRKKRGNKRGKRDNSVAIFPDADAHNGFRVHSHRNRNWKELHAWASRCMCMEPWTPKAHYKPRRKPHKAHTRGYQHTLPLGNSGIAIAHYDLKAARRVVKSRQREKLRAKRLLMREQAERRALLADALKSHSPKRGIFPYSSLGRDRNYNSINSVIGYNPIANDGKAIKPIIRGSDRLKIPIGPQNQQETCARKPLNGRFLDWSKFR